VKILIIPYLYEAQHVSCDTPPIIMSLNLHWQPLVFHMWKAVGGVVGGRCKAHWSWQRPPTTRALQRPRTTSTTAFHVWKTRGCQCRFRLLMTGGVSPETCWASYKYGIIEILTYCCILLDFSLWILFMTWNFESVLWENYCPMSAAFPRVLPLGYAERRSACWRSVQGKKNWRNIFN